MKRPYEVAGLDLDQGTIVVEIQAGILPLLAVHLRSYDGPAETVVRGLGAAFFKAGQVLFQDTPMERSNAADFNGFAILEDEGANDTEVRSLTT